jgi:hypothetical protein
LDLKGPIQFVNLVLIWEINLGDENIALLVHIDKSKSKKKKEKKAKQTEEKYSTQSAIIKRLIKINSQTSVL